MPTEIDDARAAVVVPGPVAHRIGGEWVASTSTIDVEDPTTEAIIARVPAGTPADVDAAVDAAGAALAEWSVTPPSERAALLRRAADGLEARLDELALLITREIGCPLAFSRTGQVGLPIKVMRGMAAVVEGYPWEEPIGPSLVVREPYGVVGAITPWNYPLHQVVAKVAAALGAGCTVVLKPSELAPLSALVLVEVLEAAGLPAGVLNVVHGTGPIVGEALAAHPGVVAVSLTGSSGAGRRVMELAAPTAKKVTLELGGKSATIVLDDADAAKVIPGAVLGCFRNSGQNCSALSRLVVPAGWLGQVEEIAAAVGGRVVVGDPLDPATEMGPLVSAAQRDRVLGHVRRGLDDGARLLCGGLDRPDGLDRGHFVRPTVFSAVEPGMRIAQEEIFGPVLCVLTYRSEDEAVAIANATPYGLSGAVWSADPSRAERVARRMRTGRVVINGAELNPLAPFGGYSASGVGREFGRYGLEEFLQVKTLQR